MNVLRIPFINFAPSDEKHFRGAYLKLAVDSSQRTPCAFLVFLRVSSCFSSAVDISPARSIFMFMCQYLQAFGTRA